MRSCVKIKLRLSVLCDSPAGERVLFHISWAAEVMMLLWWLTSHHCTWTPKPFPFVAQDQSSRAVMVSVSEPQTYQHSYSDNAARLFPNRFVWGRQQLGFSVCVHSWSVCMDRVFSLSPAQKEVCLYLYVGFIAQVINKKQVNSVLVNKHPQIESGWCFFFFFKPIE